MIMTANGYYAIGIHRMGGMSCEPLVAQSIAAPVRVLDAVSCFN